MPLLKHPDLPDHPPAEVPTEAAAAVLRESGWVDYEPPAPTPGIVPGTEDPPPTHKRKTTKAPVDTQGDDL